VVDTARRIVLVAVAAASFLLVANVARVGIDATNSLLQHDSVAGKLGALAPGAAWLVVARLSGTESEYLSNSKTADLLRLDSGVVSRFSPAVDGVWQEMWTIVIVAAASARSGCWSQRVPAGG
jgi:hypothetical protein